MVTKAKPHRIPAPLVLAAASAMVTIGAIAFFGPRFLGHGTTEPPRPTSEPPPIEVDDRTPEGAAEGFLDAWRKRAHADAIRLSVGSARSDSELRAEREARLDPNESAARAPWQALAKNRLRLVVKQRDVLDDGAIRLSTEAAGEFFGGPYRRVVDFEVTETPEGFRVRSIRFGDVLEAPTAIQEHPAETP